MDILAGIDIDPDAALTFSQNFPEAVSFCRDITKIRTSALKRIIGKRRPLLFSACAPCQPFSKQRRGMSPSDERAPLLLEFVRFVKYFKPNYIFIENVPGLQAPSSGSGPFPLFVQKVTRLGYKLDIQVVESCAYGVPQRRRRLIILGALRSSVSIPDPTHGPGSQTDYSVVWDWIGTLPPIRAGETHPTVSNHRAAALSEKNLIRIRTTPEGGGREHWPANLRLKCHDNDYGGHTDVYGRMRRDALASALTTRCISLSNGRFGHPTQDRAISVREAACLQTFPLNFKFAGSLNSMARQIGNAVPVVLAKTFGHVFRKHYRRRRRQSAERRLS